MNNAGGISLSNTKYSTILYASVIDVGYGIGFLNTEYTTLSHSHVKNCKFSGIQLSGAIHTTLSDIGVSNTTQQHPAISMFNSNYTKLLHVSVDNSSGIGVHALDTEYTTIFHSRINTAGIKLNNAEYTLISDTTVNDDGLHGIALCDSYSISILNTNVNPTAQCYYT